MRAIDSQQYLSSFSSVCFRLSDSFQCSPSSCCFAISSTFPHPTLSSKSQSALTSISPPLRALFHQVSHAVSPCCTSTSAFFFCHPHTLVSYGNAVNLVSIFFKCTTERTACRQTERGTKKTMHGGERCYQSSCPYIQTYFHVIDGRNEAEYSDTCEEKNGQK